MQKRLVFSRALSALLATASCTLGTAPAGAIPSLSVAAPSAAEQPALWVLSDADTTIYLFGTFHSLEAKTDWLTRNIRAAFDSSDSLMLETLVPSDPLELHRILSARQIGGPVVPGAPVVPQPRAASFAASASRAMAAGRSDGMSVDTGADAVLRRTADAEGKSVEGLESFEAQLAMFAALPAAPAQATAPAPPVDAGRVVADLRAAWRRGDCSGFAAILTRMRAQSPVTYERLFAERNDQWAQWIARRMAAPGTIFVAVGAGHLIGPDSVQQRLALRGYRATRIY